MAMSVTVQVLSLALILLLTAISASSASSSDSNDELSSAALAAERASCGQKYPHVEVRRSCGYVQIVRPCTSAERKRSKSKNSIKVCFVRRRRCRRYFRFGKRRFQIRWISRIRAKGNKGKKTRVFGIRKSGWYKYIFAIWRNRAFARRRKCKSVGEMRRRCAYGKWRAVFLIENKLVLALNSKAAFKCSHAYSTVKDLRTRCRGNKCKASFSLGDLIWRVRRAVKSTRRKKGANSKKFELKFFLTVNKKTRLVKITGGHLYAKGSADDGGISRRRAKQHKGRRSKQKRRHKNKGGKKHNQKRKQKHRGRRRNHRGRNKKQNRNSGNKRSQRKRKRGNRKRQRDRKSGNRKRQRDRKSGNRKRQRDRKRGNQKSHRKRNFQSAETSQNNEDSREKREQKASKIYDRDQYRERKRVDRDEKRGSYNGASVNEDREKQAERGDYGRGGEREDRQNQVESGSYNGEFERKDRKQQVKRRGDVREVERGDRKEQFKRNDNSEEFEGGERERQVGRGDKIKEDQSEGQDGQVERESYKGINRRGHQRRLERQKVQGYRRNLPEDNGYKTKESFSEKKPPLRQNEGNIWQKEENPKPQNVDVSSQKAVQKGSEELGIGNGEISSNNGYETKITYPVEQQTDYEDSLNTAGGWRGAQRRNDRREWKMAVMKQGKLTLEGDY